MENAEIYFRQLDRAVARENFLEKEMLDSTINHLEVRGNFFDKLAVLAAGSLSIAISFLISSFEHAALQLLIKSHLHLLFSALTLVLVSLIGCIVHNIYISSAVKLFSLRLQALYQEASTNTWWTTNSMVNERLDPKSDTAITIKRHREKAAELVKTQFAKQSTAQLLGYITLSSLILGYCLAFTDIYLIFSKV